MDPNKDGIDHINVYSKGKTDLGRWLSNFCFSKIYIPHHGTFNSVEGYWYWLSTRDDRLRGLSGFQAKKLGKELPAVTTLSQELFEFYIKMAIHHKINKHPHFRERFMYNNLPFEHYYVYGDKVVDAGYKWITQFLTDLKTEYDQIN